MAKTFKISGYLIDANDNYNIEDIKRIIEYHTDMIADLNIIVSPEWKWNDDCPENYKSCKVEDYEKRFK